MNAHLESSSRMRIPLIAIAVLGALVLAAAVTLQTSRAAFTASTSNSGNNLAAGTVVLSDDDSGSVLFNLTGMVPGTTSTKCVNVTYTGSVTADVKLFGSVSGTGLAGYLNTTIEIGSGATGGSGLSCSGFSASSTLHNGTLAAFGAANTSYANGLGGFAGATNPTTRSYRFTVALQDVNAAQGLGASATFNWEAQNV